MGTSSFIRRFVFSLPEGVIFTTRDLLIYGTRGAVDQCLYKMVKSEMIVRLAWGVFIKYGSKEPSIIDIAKAKAQAFGREIARHGAEIAKATSESSSEANQTIIFATRGRTTSFRVGSRLVKLLGVSARKILLARSTTGRIALAFWSLGNSKCPRDLLLQANIKFFRSDRQFVRQWRALMPAWLADRWLKEAPLRFYPVAIEY